MSAKEAIRPVQISLDGLERIQNEAFFLCDTYVGLKFEGPIPENAGKMLDFLTDKAHVSEEAGSQVISRALNIALEQNADLTIKLRVAEMLARLDDKTMSRTIGWAYGQETNRRSLDQRRVHGTVCGLTSILLDDGLISGGQAISLASAVMDNARDRTGSASDTALDQFDDRQQNTNPVLASEFAFLASCVKSSPVIGAEGFDTGTLIKTCCNVAYRRQMDRYALQVIAMINPDQVANYLAKTVNLRRAQFISDMVEEMAEGAISDRDYHTLNQIIDLLPKGNPLVAKDLFGALNTTVAEADKFAAIDRVRRKDFIGKIIGYIDGLNLEDYQKVINGESIIHYLEQEIAGETFVTGGENGRRKVKTVQAEIRETFVQILLRQDKSKGALMEAVSILDSTNAPITVLKPDVAKRLYDLIQASHLDLSFWSETIKSKDEPKMLALSLFDNLPEEEKIGFLFHPLLDIFETGGRELQLIEHLREQHDYELLLSLLVKPNYLKTAEQKAYASEYIIRTTKVVIPVEFAEDILANAEALKTNLGLSDKEFLHYANAYAEKMVIQLRKDLGVKDIAYVVNSLPSVLARRVVMKILRDGDIDYAQKQNLVGKLTAKKFEYYTSREARTLWKYATTDLERANLRNAFVKKNRKR